MFAGGVRVTKLPAAAPPVSSRDPNSNFSVVIQSVSPGRRVPA